jgi:hypothetical protein
MSTVQHNTLMRFFASPRYDVRHTGPSATALTRELLNQSFDSCVRCLFFVVCRARRVATVLFLQVNSFPVASRFFDS